jgi:ABC-type phosphate/phosphonate transport system substrate-binding protein
MMKTTHHPLMVCAALALTLLTSTLVASDPGKPANATFHIGISEALIRGQTTPSAAMIQVQPMAKLFQIMNSVKPEFQFATPDHLAKLLSDGKVKLAVMPGIEYGWLGEKAKDLAPVAVAYTNDIKLKAYIIAKADTKGRKVGDLRGKKLAMARRTQHHTQVFLTESISKVGCCPTSFFADCTVTQDTDAAIESVLDGVVEAVAIDSHSWTVFCERKPGRAKRLMIIAESPHFPTAVIVYKPGVISDEQLQSLREGLMTAHQKPFCKQIMNFWRISQFVPFTPEYDQIVKGAVKEMPQPIIPVQFSKPE